MSPDGSVLFVALSGSPMAPPGVDESTLPPADKKADGIGVVSVQDLKLLRVLPAGSDRSRPRFRDGTQLFVANEDTGQLTAVNVEDGRVLATFTVGDEPEGVDLRPDGRVVYVTSEEDSQVAVIDVPSLKLLTTFKVGPRPRSTTFLPEQHPSLRDLRERRIGGVVDAQKHRVLETIQLSGESIRPMVGVASPDGAQVFISTGRGKNVAVLDTATNKPVAFIEVGDARGVSRVSRWQDCSSRQTAPRTTYRSWTSTPVR